MAERGHSSEDFENVVALLIRAGFSDSEEEAGELVEAAAGDGARLEHLVGRRLDGEPLSWLTGTTTFLGHTIFVDRGVYVPRPQTEPMARQAVDLLPAVGFAADLATGSGALAVTMQRARPAARVVATDIDAGACRCAKRNGVDVYQGDLGEPLPNELLGRFDVITAVVPYVPTDELVFLPSDVQRHEPRAALDGGEEGLEVLVRTVLWAEKLLHSGGRVLLELGGEQDTALLPALTDARFVMQDRFFDADGDLRGIEAVRR
ncbi:MAG: N5-glutamine methyltransferase family protein [Acidimicrobiales bacterium]